MLVVDFLHNLELGVWKALFTHLIQILHAAAPHGSLVAKLDRWYVSCTVSYQELINFSVTNNQVSGHANVWLKHNQAFCNECLRNEEACSTWLKRRSSSDFFLVQHPSI